MMRDSMDFFNSRYFLVNKVLLSLSGAWPYQKMNIKIPLLLINFFCIIIGVVSQVTCLFKNWKNLDAVLEVTPLTCGLLVIITKFLCLVCNFKKFKVLLQSTQENWDDLPKGQETQIMTQHAEIGRKFAHAYLYSVLIFFPCYTLWPLAAPILDIISPLNETRPKKLVFEVDSFLNTEKYYYTILLSEFVNFGVSLISILATDMTYFLLLKHICGMQAVLCYRLKNLKVYQSHWSDTMKYRVQRCIQLDKRIRTYVKGLESVFTIILSIDVALGAVAYTCSCIMIVIQVGQSEIMPYVAVAILQAIRFFFVSWLGQELIDYSSAIPIAAYDAMWYFMPIQVQNMIMLLIMRSQRPSRFLVAGVYIISLENFTSVMKTSMSYCTIMISVRQTM